MRFNHKGECSPTSYPYFEPHITLASVSSSSAPLLPDLCAVIRATGLLSVEFESIEIGSHFFRSVYVAIKTTPALTALHEHLHTKLGLEPHTPAFPHLSLCYIDDEDGQKGEREMFSKDLESTGKVERGHHRVRLHCGESGWMDGFSASEVWVVNCEGPVEGWTILDRVSLV